VGLKFDKQTPAELSHRVREPDLREGGVPLGPIMGDQWSRHARRPGVLGFHPIQPPPRGTSEAKRVDARQMGFPNRRYCNTVTASSVSLVLVFPTHRHIAKRARKRDFPRSHFLVRVRETKQMIIIFLLVRTHVGLFRFLLLLTSSSSSFGFPSTDSFLRALIPHRLIGFMCEERAAP
jgi:hypothetical protein